jgi:catechol 2,3-dioxygenase
MRLGYVHIRVTDLAEAVDHYSNTLGMAVVHEEPGKVHLKCWDEWDHHSLVLEEGGVGLVKLGYKCSSEDDLAEFEKRSAQFGATTGRFSSGENMTVGDGVRITLPPSTPSSCNPKWSSPAPTPGRSTLRRGPETFVGSVGTGSTMR